MQERLTPAVVNSLDKLETQFAKTHCLVTPAALDVVCQRTACKTPAVQNRPAERVFFSWTGPKKSQMFLSSHSMRGLAQQSG